MVVELTLQRVNAAPYGISPADGVRILARLPGWRRRELRSVNGYLILRAEFDDETSIDQVSTEFNEVLADPTFNDLVLVASEAKRRPG